MKNILLFLLALIAPANLVFSLEDIDVVYTWVDGSDELWQKNLKTFIDTHGLQDYAGASALAKKRFRNHDELRYSLRSIEAFAPWVHHIFIVTCGQRPKWFKDHPKITFIDHSAIFKNKENLPTYNSMAIESNLHRIPNLSERYIYFNDDVFLGSPTTPNDFYTKDGKFLLFFSRHSMKSSVPKLGEEGFYAANKNTLCLLNSTYEKKHRFQHSHTPFPSLKSVVQKIEALHPAIFSLVSSHHFRSLHDYTLTNGLIPYISLQKKWARASTDCACVTTICRSLEKDAAGFAKLKATEPKFFCLQDSGGEEDSAMLTQIQAFFTTYFQNKAEWEIDNPKSVAKNNDLTLEGDEEDF
jgi:hypothetical protein